MKFIRVHGRVIPVKDGSATGNSKKAQAQKHMQGAEDGAKTALVGLGAAAVGKASAEGKRTFNKISEAHGLKSMKFARAAVTSKDTGNKFSYEGNKRVAKDLAQRSLAAGKIAGKLRTGAIVGLGVGGGMFAVGSTMALYHTGRAIHALKGKKNGKSE